MNPRRVPIPVWKAFHPTWRKSALALLAAVLLGTIGVFLQLDTLCWNGTHDCAAYSRNEVAAARAMSWPVFIAQEISFDGSGPTSNYDPVIRRYWWIIMPVLWVYYYVIFAMAILVANSIRSVWIRE